MVANHRLGMPDGVPFNSNAAIPEPRPIVRVTLTEI
jgi:hypothetical protein